VETAAGSCHLRWLRCRRDVGDVEDDEVVFATAVGRLMTTSVLLGRMLAVGAVIEAVAGLGLLLAPSMLAELLLRDPLAGAGPIIARLGGGGLLALGIACWFARRTPSTAAGLGVARAFLAYNLVACGVLIAAYPPLPSGLAALSVAVLHGLLAIALLATLLAPREA